MPHDAKPIVTRLLEGIRDAKIAKNLCAADVTNVSLNYSNPDLHKIMPWCGTGQGAPSEVTELTTAGALLSNEGRLQSLKQEQSCTRCVGVPFQALDVEKPLPADVTV